MDVTLNDVTRTFDENKVSMAELHNYLRSVGNFAVDRQVPRFPVRLTEEEDPSAIALARLSATLEEKDKPSCAAVASTSAETIGNGMQGPTTSMGCPALSAWTVQQQRSEEEKQRKAQRPQIRIPAFPSFDGMRALDLGFSVPPETDDAEEGKTRVQKVNIGTMDVRRRPGRPRKRQSSSAEKAPEVLSSSVDLKNQANARKDNVEEKRLGAEKHSESPTALRLRSRAILRPSSPDEKEGEDGKERSDVSADLLID
ncbi:hypothetical protein AAVH_12165 [Aphelenchoides avenae]|nr:hypothetical protein AAVH_12165 [Aphelenchus avenae]